MVDQLAIEMADQPVVFLEHDVDDPQGQRISRWWTAWGTGGNVTLPLIMVDSGQQISSGSQMFYEVYRGMVEEAMARPPEARLQVSRGREGSRLFFTVEVENLSDVTLGPENEATVHAIVYEEAHVADTDRWVRGAGAVPITAWLEPGDTATFSVQAETTGVQDWDKVHSVVLVDYQPGVVTGPFDMLQAVHLP